MKPEWEKGLRGSLYAWGRSVVPLSWRRAIRRRLAPERLLGIRKPAVELARYDFEPREVRPGRPDLLFLPVIAWSYRRQRPQQLAEALGRLGKRVFYGAIRGPGEPEHPTGVAPGVTVLPIAGVRREDPGDRRLEGRSLDAAFDSLGAARDEFGMHECAVLVESPFWAPLAARLRERFGWKAVYDCLDEHGAFEKYRDGAMREEERALVESADLVVATSAVLLERLSPRARASRLLPNGCDYELFAGEPEPRAEGAGVTVGYVGAVDDWFDGPLFDELARLRPDWRFEIVGAGEGREDSRPAAASNVEFHGERPHRELPTLRARFDVEIIPFRLTPLTHAVDPVKLYEAAAAGRPTVATPMRSLLPLADRGLVRLASTASEFAEQIDRAARASSAERERLRAFARENTWDARAGELERWLTALYPLVSVAVVAGNGLERNRSCLESLDRRTDWPNVEMVWADGSSDGTTDWLERESRERDPERFRVIPVPSAAGWGPAVNAAFERARGASLCVLESSAIVTRGWLSALLRHLDSDASLGIVSASTNRIDDAGEIGHAAVEVGYRDSAELETWARRFCAARRGAADPADAPAIFCAVMPRRVWEKVGGLDERFRTVATLQEDYARRLSAGGWRVAVARDAFVHRLGIESSRPQPDPRALRILEEDRARFEEKWKAAPRQASRPRKGSEILAEAHAAGALFVFPPSIPWDTTLVQRPHHLARALARRGFPVVFEVEESEPGESELRETEPNLYLAAPQSRKLASARVVYWSFPYNVPDPGRLSGARLVYDVIDHPDVFPHSRSLLRRNHERALAAADAVFAVSRPLCEELLARRPDAVYLPNGVDFERFLEPPDPGAVPERLVRSRSEGRPVAGFLGALARWVDSDLLTELARARPDWDVAVIGEPLDDSCEALAAPGAPANLILVGPVRYRRVPATLSAFDVGLIPFRLGSEGVHASPIKLYEYLAAALPVISTRIPEAEAIPEALLASDAAGFAALLDRARAERGSESFRSRARERARDNDWSARVERALAAIPPAAARDRLRSEGA